MAFMKLVNMESFRNKFNSRLEKKIVEFGEMRDEVEGSAKKEVKIQKVIDDA